MPVTPLGTLTGGAINTGVALAIPTIELKLGDVLGLIASMQANLDVMIGLNIPNPIDLTLGLEAALSAVADLSINLPSASLSLAGTIEVELALLLALSVSLGELLATLTAGMNAGGIAAYAYEGAASNLGSEVGQATSGGIAGTSPSNNVNALVLACADPSAWASLGLILKTE